MLKMAPSMSRQKKIRQTNTRPGPFVKFVRSDVLYACSSQFSFSEVHPENIGHCRLPAREFWQHPSFRCIKSLHCEIYIFFRDKKTKYSFI